MQKIRLKKVNFAKTFGIGQFNQKPSFIKSKLKRPHSKTANVQPYLMQCDVIVQLPLYNI